MTLLIDFYPFLGLLSSLFSRFVTKYVVSVVELVPTGYGTQDPGSRHHDWAATPPGRSPRGGKEPSGESNPPWGGLRNPVAHPQGGLGAFLGDHLPGGSGVWSGSFRWIILPGGSGAIRGINPPGGGRAPSGGSPPPQGGDRAPSGGSPSRGGAGANRGIDPPGGDRAPSGGSTPQGWSNSLRGGNHPGVTSSLGGADPGGTPPKGISTHTLRSDHPQGICAPKGNKSPRVPE